MITPSVPNRNEGARFINENFISASHYTQTKYNLVSEERLPSCRPSWYHHLLACANTLVLSGQQFSRTRQDWLPSSRLGYHRHPLRIDQQTMKSNSLTNLPPPASPLSSFVSWWGERHQVMQMASWCYPSPQELLRTSSWYYDRIGYNFVYIEKEENSLSVSFCTSDQLN